MRGVLYPVEREEFGGERQGVSQADHTPSSTFGTVNQVVETVSVELFHGESTQFPRVARKSQRRASAGYPSQDGCPQMGLFQQPARSGKRLWGLGGPVKRKGL